MKHVRGSENSKQNEKENTNVISVKRKNGNVGRESAGEEHIKLERTAKLEHEREHKLSKRNSAEGL